MAHAAEAGNVDAGFHSDDLTGQEGGIGKTRRLVNFEPEPMTRAVEEALPAAVFFLRGIYLRGEMVFEHVVDDSALGAGLHGIVG